MLEGHGKTEYAPMQGVPNPGQLPKASDGRLAAAHALARPPRGHAPPHAEGLDLAALEAAASFMATDPAFDGRTACRRARPAPDLLQAAITHSVNVAAGAAPPAREAPEAGRRCPPSGR